MQVRFTIFLKDLDLFIVCSFTRNSDSTAPYFTRTEVQSLIDDLMGGTNGLWDVTPETLDAMSETIASKFDFTVAQAGS